MPNLIFVLFRRLRSPLITLILVYTISIIGFVLIPGIDDQGNPWKMSFFHAFYFVSFMGTTIGFGEIPYAFTDAQRFWALLTMYATVVAWLYGIGMLLSVFQDAAFIRSVKNNAFNRRIKRIREPFYIICGYGDTGSQLAHALSKQGILSVVIDVDEDRINELEADDFLVPPISLCADVSVSEVLENAGISHMWCRGIITLVNDDSVNLTVAVIAELLNPDLRLISRAETHEAEANILSFGANEVINPFEAFASRLALALKSPSLYCLYDWMTGPTGRMMREPPLPKAGKWIICGYGRFGRTLYDHLDDEGIVLQVIEADRTVRDLPSGSIIGRSTEAVALEKAGIREASGIIAATDNDANNLSIIMTAQEINPDIFCIARENQDKNEHLFQSAHLGMLMQRGTVISNTIFAFIKTPMLGDFLRIVSRFNTNKANLLVSQIIGTVKEKVPELWEICINEKDSPALYEVMQKRQVLVSDILQCEIRCKYNNHKNIALALFLKRGKGNVLLPEDNRIVREDDRFLMCGTSEARQIILHLLNDINLLESVLTGEDIPAGWFFKKLRAMKLDSLSLSENKDHSEDIKNL